MLEIPSHWIEVVIQNAWPKVVTCIEDEAIDKACGKLSWYQHRYEEMTKASNLLRRNCPLKGTTAIRQRKRILSLNQSSITSARRLSLQGSARPPQHHAIGMSGSPSQTLPVLSKHSAKIQGNDRDTITLLLNSLLGE